MKYISNPILGSSHTHPNNNTNNVLTGSNVKELEKTQSITQYGKSYKVIVHNDDYTSMDFVIKVLIDFFEKDYPQAYQIMMFVHERGSAVAGIYSKEIAETKIYLVERLAEEHQFPLKLTLEKNNI